MNRETGSAGAGGGRIDGEGRDGDRSDAAPAVPAAALLLTGLVSGLVGDALLRAPGPPGLNAFLWIASVGVAALVLHRRAGLGLDRERVAWLLVGTSVAAGLVWRDAPPLKLLALGSAAFAFGLAAYRDTAAWVRRAGVLRYVLAFASGALRAWTGAVLALVDAGQRTARAQAGGRTGWRRVSAVLRGLVIATPFVLVFGALFMSADAVFADLVRNAVHADLDLIASHLLLFSVCAWLAIGYLRGFMTGTELPPLSVAPRRPTLGITEVATALAAIDLLFLLFVIVQFRYLFGSDVLVQVTPDLTYADYARRGFFELVVAVGLVVPVLLAADWLLARERSRDHLVFRGLAGVQIALVFVITASALQRLRLYHASYGLTDSRFYAMVLLIWIGAMLLWFAGTVLRGRRDSFAFGALVAGLSTVGLLFIVNPDAIVARTNAARMTLADARVRFDVAYARSLSADAVPALIDALTALPADVQCRLAVHLLTRWPPDRERSLRSWSWSAARASDAVREHEARLRAMIGPDRECPAPGS